MSGNLMGDTGSKYVCTYVLVLVSCSLILSRGRRFLGERARHPSRNEPGVVFGTLRLAGLFQQFLPPCQQKTYSYIAGIVVSDEAEQRSTSTHVEAKSMVLSRTCFLQVRTGGGVREEVENREGLQKCVARAERVLFFFCRQRLERK